MTREEIKKAMRDTKREIVIKNLHKLLSLVEGYPEYEDCISYAIEELEQEPNCSEIPTGSTTKNDLAVEKIVDVLGSYTDLDIPYKHKIAEDILNNLPSVTLQEPKTGHWEHGRELSRVFIGDALRGINYEDWHCSNCHCVIEQSIKPKWNYCPNCGAKMQEVEE